jgi:AraC-like DNA-binding protein
MQAMLEIVRNDNSLIQYPFSCFLQNNNGQDFYIEPHYHNDVELLYFYEGKAHVIVGSEYYLIKQGEMILINSNEIHAILAQKEDYTNYICITVNPSMLYSGSHNVFESKYVLPFTTMKNYTRQRVFFKNDLEESLVPKTVNDIFNEYSRKEYGFEVAIHIDIYRIFLWLLRNWENQGINLSQKSTTLNKNEIERLQCLFDYIDSHFNEDITASTVVGICHIDYSYFSRQFKKVTGKTFKEYLNYVRITEAEKLLLTTNLNVTEISLRTGFSNVSYFIKTFRNLKNISPKQVRKLLDV